MTPGAVGNAETDIDPLLVRPDEVDDDAPTWVAQRYDLARHLERWTGNRAQTVELSARELRRAVRRGDALVDLRRDGRERTGQSLRSLLSPAKAGR